MEKRLRKRLRKNPHPTELELRLGAFLEELEPQAGEAILDFNRKGYSTSSSGFGGLDGSIQQIDGAFVIDNETRARLETIGVSVDVEKAWGKDYTTLVFRPSKPDLAEMKVMWSHIAAMLPDKGQPAPPCINDAAEHFRRNYGRGTKSA